MSLRTTAQRLAHPFVRLHVYWHKTLVFVRDFNRDRKAARIRSAAETRSTAIHEAGHAAMLIALGLAFIGASIIPDVRSGTLGRVVWSQDQVTTDMRAGEAAYLRYAMVYYAGAEAVRQLIPTHPNPDAGASADKRYATDLIRRYIGDDALAIDLLLSVAKRRCASLVEHYQPEIQALAGVLEAEQTLLGKAARKVFMRSLTQRGGRLLSFESDPRDEAFLRFLRKLNLPGIAN